MTTLIISVAVLVSSLLVMSLSVALVITGISNFVEDLQNETFNLFNGDNNMECDCYASLIRYIAGALFLAMMSGTMLTISISMAKSLTLIV